MTNSERDLAKRKAPRTAFKKGHKKVGGRKKGVQNKFTRDIKEALLQAFNDVGGQAWFKKLATKDARSFSALIGKLLPTQLTGKDGGPIDLLVQRAQGGLSNLTDKELETLQILLAKAGLKENQ